MNTKEALEIFHKKPLSWSSISSFKYNKQAWYDSYILGVKKDSKEMQFGKMVDERIQKDPKFFPKLPRYDLMQHKMKAKVSGINILGIPDGINFINKKEICDFKTGKKKWDLKRARETGQILFYLLLLYITEGIKPEEFTCYIHWIPTKETKDFKITYVKKNYFETFEFRHTLQEVLNFAREIVSTYKEMEKFIVDYKK